MTDAGAVTTTQPTQGWRKLLLALLVFVIAPVLIPQLAAMAPVDKTMALLVPALAACALVGWWLGGRMLSAVLWVGLAVVISRQPVASTEAYSNLLGGWTLLLAGAFGLACLIRPAAAFFTKALAAVTASFAFALLVSLLGPVTLDGIGAAIAEEFGQRNAQMIKLMTDFITAMGPDWKAITERAPAMAATMDEVGPHLAAVSQVGQTMFPALLALQSLAALAIAWAVYHRLSRQRIGAPLSPLREFRFNDQLVWGLIVGLVILLLPSLAGLRGLGANLVLFFGALYAIRGLGVLAWFMAPRRFATILIAGFVLVFVPVLNFVAILGFMTLGVTALGLGVGDTWADWRSRARSTLS